MKTMQSILGAVSLAALLSAPAFAQSTYAPESKKKDSVTSPAGRSAPSKEIGKSEEPAGERAAFRWESSTERVKQAQESLNKHGSALKADGVMGEDTRRELRKYQRQNKLTETGRIDDATAKSLGIEMK